MNTNESSVLGMPLADQASAAGHPQDGASRPGPAQSDDRPIPDALTLGEIPLVRPRALTRRQHDCVLLVASGKSDEEVARALGISRLTAHKHVEAAKKRYGVTTRMRLVVDALFAKELSFAAIFAADCVAPAIER